MSAHPTLTPTAAVRARALPPLTLVTDYGSLVSNRRALNPDQERVVALVRASLDECARAEAELHAARARRDALVRAHLPAVGARPCAHALGGAISETALRTIHKSAPPP